MDDRISRLIAQRPEAGDAVECREIAANYLLDVLPAHVLRKLAKKVTDKTLAARPVPASTVRKATVSAATLRRRVDEVNARKAAKKVVISLQEQVIAGEE
ncbi:hypothetical protein [Sphingomonas sp.]|uniref:hypothetical protein n=1 Tax=Sphingomonas sp. TaxID=28214 RepID=UPI000DB7DEE1|nr:hypothetical protein [Sphingomonas sp.]PZU10063.1 MAG: hypothetical protein DI605_05530 [Sphingomonas sp.]